MGKVVVRIPFVTWRDGRPRYFASPAHRALGFKGEDLRHGRTGPWFTLDEAIIWSERRVAAVEEARRIATDKTKTAARRHAREIQRRPDVLTIGALLEELFETPRFNGRAVVAGKRQRKPLAKNTVLFYRHRANALRRFRDGEVWSAPVTDMTRRAASMLYERLTEIDGLSGARGCIALLSMCWSWAEKNGRPGISGNPFLRLGMETPPPRLRVGELDEMRRLIAAADAIDRPDVGDMIALGLCTGQRQADRMAIVDGSIVAGRLVFRQSKTGAIAAVPPAPLLVARLEAMRARRADTPVRFAELSIDERIGRRWTHERYVRAFAAVRAAAVAGVRDEDGEGWRVAPMQSLADFRDQDLRDTAVTWLAMAGCTVPEICAITGHSEQSATQILKHYLARRPEMADAGIRKLVEWMGEGTG